MSDNSLSSFESPSRHAAVSDILRRHSTNPADVRAALLQSLDLSGVRSVLDLGCGYGFMIAAVAQRVAPDARIVGIDACPANERPYLDAIAATGRTGRFICQRLDAALDWPADHFDLVVASYALYFFPGVLPDIARVLKPDGLFLAITHTESSCRDLLQAAGLPTSDPRLFTGIRRFSIEGGSQLLTPWFERIERVDYANTLVFDATQFDDFLVYLRFKLPILEADAGPGGALPRPLADAIRTSLSRQSRITLEKNDAVFRCRGPRCR